MNLNLKYNLHRFLVFSPTSEIIKINKLCKIGQALKLLKKKCVRYKSLSDKI